MIEPKVLKGFRDSLPTQELVRQRLVDEVKHIFRSFGFVPIDTPALEYTEVLLGKGGGETDKQMFRFTDNGGRDVALRFDLTVPLARYVSANFSQLNFPFKRYHISKVWRGEKPQKGRFREFMQCDFDIIGCDNVQSDFEILLLIQTCLSKMGVGPFKVLVSHRGLLNKFLASKGIDSKSDAILRAIDKLGKIGKAEVCEILKDEGLTDENISDLMTYIELPKESFEETLNILKTMFSSDCEEINRLNDLYGLMKNCGIEKDFVIDTSITRGLDYYTGIVYETVLLDMPQIGSICSGGRYNNLAGLYTKENLPGVGSCIGIDRLMAALEEIGSPLVTQASFSDVLIASSSDPLWAETTAFKLRNIGIKVDCYTGTKGMGQQFAYAESNGIKYVICSETDGKYKVKEIQTRNIIESITLEELAEKIK